MFLSRKVVSKRKNYFRRATSFFMKKQDLLKAIVFQEGTEGNMLTILQFSQLSDILIRGELHNISLCFK